MVHGSGIGEPCRTTASNSATVQQDTREFSDPGEDDLDDLDGMLETRNSFDTQ